MASSWRWRSDDPAILSDNSLRSILPSRATPAKAASIAVTTSPSTRLHTDLKHALETGPRWLKRGTLPKVRCGPHCNLARYSLPFTSNSKPPAASSSHRIGARPGSVCRTRALRLQGPQLGAEGGDCRLHQRRLGGEPPRLGAPPARRSRTARWAWMALITEVC